MLGRGRWRLKGGRLLRTEGHEPIEGRVAGGDDNLNGVKALGMAHCGGVPYGLQVKRLRSLPDPVAGRRVVEVDAAQVQQYFHNLTRSGGSRLSATGVFTPYREDTIGQGSVADVMPFFDKGADEAPTAGTCRLRACGGGDSTAFRVEDELGRSPRVEPSRGRGATVQPWAGLCNPFRIALIGESTAFRVGNISRAGYPG